MKRIISINNSGLGQRFSTALALGPTCSRGPQVLIHFWGVSGSYLRFAIWPLSNLNLKDMSNIRCALNIFFWFLSTHPRPIQTGSVTHFWSATHQLRMTEYQELMFFFFLSFFLFNLFYFLLLHWTVRNGFFLKNEILNILNRWKDVFFLWFWSCHPRGTCSGNKFLHSLCCSALVAADEGALQSSSVAPSVAVWEIWCTHSSPKTL